MNFLLALFLSTIAPGVAAQIQRNADELVGVLLEPKIVCKMTNGGYPRQRSAALDLLNLGGEARTDVRRGVDELERGHQLEDTCGGIEWLLYAFARLEGEGSFPRLSRMHELQVLRP